MSVKFFTSLLHQIGDESTIVKTQLNHNQVEVGLTTLWVLIQPPQETLCCCGLS